MYYWNRHTSQWSLAKCFIGLFSNSGHRLTKWTVRIWPLKSTWASWRCRIANLTPSGDLKPCLNLKRKVEFQDMMLEQLKQVVIIFYRLGKRNQLRPVCCFSMSLMSLQVNIQEMAVNESESSAWTPMRNRALIWKPRLINIIEFSTTTRNCF